MSAQDAHARWQGSAGTLGERSAYKRVWDRQAQDFDVASLAVAGDSVYIRSAGNLYRIRQGPLNR